jgi:Ala-tRNA(Pro) deacylase
MVLTQIAMVAIMTMTPVHMRAHGHGLGEVGLVIGIHIGAMYLPSLATGVLVDKIGRVPMAVASGVTLLLAGVTAAFGPADSLGVLMLALALLGLGWNFGLISGDRARGRRDRSGDPRPYPGQHRRVDRPRRRRRRRGVRHDHGRNELRDPVPGGRRLVARADPRPVLGTATLANARPGATRPRRTDHPPPRKKGAELTTDRNAGTASRATHGTSPKDPHGDPRPDAQQHDTFAFGSTEAPNGPDGDRPERIRAGERDRLIAHLAGIGIDAPVVPYPEHSSIEEGKRLRGDLPGTFTKNLLLRDKKGRLFFVTAFEDTDIDLKSLHTRIGARGRLGFAPAELMAERLRVTPGTATPLGLLNDTENTITLVVDDALADAEQLNFHPMTHDESIGLSWRQFNAFLASCGREPVVVPLGMPLG